MKKLQKGELTDQKKKYENNDILHDITNDAEYPIIHYAFNEMCFYLDSPSENKVSNSKHTQYIEAIIGAIF